MNLYHHSVSLDESKCTGCTTCLKRCPTEAIRIRDGHAVISTVRCIDCGECIRVCPHKAKRAVHDGLESLHDFRYTVALPAPSLYGQFENLERIGYVISGLKKLGFDGVYDMNFTADLTIMEEATELIDRVRGGGKLPVITSCSPGWVKFCEHYYPEFLNNLSC